MKKLLIFLLFLVLGFAIYGRSLTNPFVMDDEIQIVGNQHIQNLSEWPSYFTSSTMDSGGAARMGGVYYKPLMTTFYAVTWNFFKDDSYYYHLPLLVVHIFSAFLITLFSMNFLPLIYSTFLGLIFLLHPANSEVVLYIADTQDLFYFFFGILSLYSIQKIESKKILFSVLVALFSLGLMSKETGALFLLFGCTYVFFLMPKKKWPVWGAAFLVGISYLILRINLGMIATKNEALLFHSASFFERLKMLPLILGHYIEIYFFPSRLSLATDFVLNELTFSQFWFPLILVISFLVGLLYLMTKLYKVNKKILLFFISVFVGWFILHGQMIVPLDGVYADRWFYIGVWGLSSILMIFLVQKFDSKKLKISLLFILIAFSFRTYFRSLVWSEPLALYQREAELHPWDAIMVNNVGVELFRQNRVSVAGPYFLKATELNPHWNVAINNLGAFEEQQGHNEEALKLYFKSLTVAAYPLAYENYAKLLVKMGKRELAYAFIKEQALPLYPNNQILQALWKLLNQYQK